MWNEELNCISSSYFCGGDKLCSDRSLVLGNVLVLSIVVMDSSITL